MVDQAVDSGHGRHRVLEDLIPLGEDQVGGDNDGLLLVALGEEMEKDLHLLGRLLDVADVVDDYGVETLEPGDGLRKLQVALGDQKLGDQSERPG